MLTKCFTSNYTPCKIGYHPLFNFSMPTLFQNYSNIGSHPLFNFSMPTLFQTRKIYAGARFGRQESILDCVCQESIWNESIFREYLWGEYFRKYLSREYLREYLSREYLSTEYLSTEYLFVKRVFETVFVQKTWFTKAVRTLTGG